MDEELYVPSDEDYDEAEAAEMRAACIGQDLGVTDRPRMLGLLAYPAGIKSSSRDGVDVNLVCIHTAEGARTARSLAAFFARSDVQASSHAAIDASEKLELVPYSRAAWTLRSGNKYSDNLEICGFARWTRAQWMSTGTVDGCVNPRKMLDRTAAWITARCKARGIPVRRLSLAQVRSYSDGVIHHDDWTKAMNDGTHWDVGTGFPWDYVLAKAQEDDMQLSDDINLKGEHAGTILGVPTITVDGALGYAAASLKVAEQNALDIDHLHKNVHTINDKVNALAAELVAFKQANDAKLAEILAALKEGTA